MHFFSQASDDLEKEVRPSEECGAKQERGANPWFKVEGGEEVVDVIAVLLSQGAPVGRDGEQVRGFVVAGLSRQFHHLAPRVRVQRQVAQPHL